MIWVIVATSAVAAGRLLRTAPAISPRPDQLHRVSQRRAQRAQTRQHRRSPGHLRRHARTRAAPGQNRHSQPRAGPRSGAGGPGRRRRAGRCRGWSRNSTCWPPSRKLRPCWDCSARCWASCSVFARVEDAGLNAARRPSLRRHLGRRLICTAAGLAVSIPSYAGYNYLVSRVNNIVLDMEQVSSEILNIVSASGPEESAPSA